MADAFSTQSSEIANGYLNNNSNVNTLAYKRISRARNWLLLLPFIGFALQLLMDSSIENGIASLLASTAAFLVFYDAFSFKRLIRYPLSTLIVLGFGTILNLCPLLITFAERKPIVYNLNFPVYTFFHCFLITCIVLIAHGIYRSFTSFQSVRLFVQGILVKLRIFDPISFKEVWPFAILGFVATYLARDTQGVVPDTPLFKFLEGFRFLLGIPVVYYLQSVWFKDKSHHLYSIRNPLINVCLYFILLSIVAILTNTRAVLIGPLSTLVFGLGLASLYGLFRLERKSLIGIALVLFLILPFASDLSSAMRQARASRGDVSQAELFLITLENLQDREGLRRYQDAVNRIYASSNLADEYYYDNEMLNRFANIKVVDQYLQNHLEIVQQGRRQEARSIMSEYHWHRVLSIFPTPFLAAIGFPAGFKESIINHSWGDKHLSVVQGLKQPRFISHRVAHFSGPAMTAFDYLYLLILLGGLLVVFTFAESHCISPSSLSQSSPVLSIIAFSSLLGWFIIPISNDINSFYLFAGRDFWQGVILLFGMRWLIMARL